jgi:hypothetical protein
MLPFESTIICPAVTACDSDQAGCAGVPSALTMCRWPLAGAQTFK